MIKSKFIYLYTLNKLLYSHKFPFVEGIVFFRFFNGCITFNVLLETSRGGILVFGEYFSLVTVRCDLIGGTRY